MWLPVDAVLHELFPGQEVDYNHALPTDAFDGVRLFNPDIQAQDTNSYLYLVSQAMLDSCPNVLLSRQFMAHTTFLCPCTTLSPLDELQQNLSLVRLRTDADFATVFNRCGDLFQRFANWDRDVHLALLREAGLSELLELSRPLLRRTTLVVDHSRNVLGGFLSHWTVPNALHRSLQSGKLSPDGQRILDELELIPADDDAQDLLVRDYTGPEGEALCAFCLRFQSNGLESGRMYQLGCPAQDRAYHTAVLSLIRDSFAPYFKKSAYASPLSDQAYESVLADILEHPQADPQAYRRRVTTYLNQSMTGRFLLARVDAGAGAKFSPNLIAWSIRNAFPDIFPFVHRNRFYLLRCFSPRQDCRRFLSEGEWNKFRSLYGDAPILVGESNLFFSLMDLAYAAKQCSVALETDPLPPNALFVRYQDVLLPYLVSGLRSVMPIQMFASPAYSLLKEHDLSHGDDLRTVVLGFLRHSQSINDTAEALYMHRNTVTKKLKKAQALTQIDHWSDGEAFAFILSHLSDRDRDHL